MVHYHFHHSLRLVLILCHINPVNTPENDLFQIHCNIHLPSMSSSSKWSLSFRLPPQKHCMPFLSPIGATSSTNFILLDYSDSSLWKVKIIKLFNVQLPPFPWYFIHHRSKYLSHHIILTHPQPSSSLQVSSQVSHQYKTTGKIWVLYVLKYLFLEAKRKTEDSGPNGIKHSWSSFCS